MRINRYLALATGLSRRAADQAVQKGRVLIDGKPAQPASQVQQGQLVTLDNKPVATPQDLQTIILNKPVGYVVSRNGQGSQTIYNLLPPELSDLKPVGRLDKDSSGLLVLTNDGELANRLTHPSYRKVKVYKIALDQPLQPLHRQMISDMGVQLEDGPSKLQLDRLQDGDETKWQVTMHEGRNRQIRRTFAALGYEVRQLHRTNFGQYSLESLKPGSYRQA